MNNKNLKILDELCEIATFVRERGVEARRFTTTLKKPRPTREEAYAHLAWTCFAVTGLITSGRREEATLLLGEARGILLCHGEGPKERPFLAMPAIALAIDPKVVNLDSWRA